MLKGLWLKKLMRSRKKGLLRGAELLLQHVIAFIDVHRITEDSKKCMSSDVNIIKKNLFFIMFSCMTLNSFMNFTSFNFCN